MFVYKKLKVQETQLSYDMINDKISLINEDFQLYPFVVNTETLEKFFKRNKPISFTAAAQQYKNIECCKRLKKFLNH